MTSVINTDPFYEAQNEVKISLNNLQNLFHSWQNLFDKNSVIAKEKYSLIRQEITYLHEDLNDLDNSIIIVKNNSAKFNINENEIQNRITSVQEIRNSLNGIRKYMNDYDAMSYNNNNNNNNNNNMKNQYEDVNSNLLKRQDNDLEELAESAQRLHHAAITINTELKDQQKLLDELEDEMENSNIKMNFVTKRISKYLKTNNPRTLSLICYLSLIAFALTLILVVT